MSDQHQSSRQHIPAEKGREATKSQRKDPRSRPPKDKPHSHRAKCKATETSSLSSLEPDGQSHTEKHHRSPNKKAKHAWRDSIGSIEETVDMGLDLELESVSEHGYVAAESSFEEHQGDDMVMVAI